MKHLHSVLLASCIATAGCPSWWQRTPEHIEDVAKIVDCVMNEYDKDPRPSISTIAMTCGLKNWQEVLDLVQAQKTAEARHSKSSVCASAGVSTVASTSASVSAAPSAKPSATPSTKPSPSAKP